MRQVFAAFRLAFDQGRSQREIARALGLSQRTVHEYLRRFRAVGLGWPLPPEVDEAVVDARLFASDAVPTTGRAVPDWPALHADLKRKGVTLRLLWLEYKQQTPDGYQYTPFCRRYRAWTDTVEPALRQVHVAGEKTFVDYAGLTMPVHDVGLICHKPDKLYEIFQVLFLYVYSGLDRRVMICFTQIQLLRSRS